MQLKIKISYVQGFITANTSNRTIEMTWGETSYAQAKGQKTT